MVASGGPAARTVVALAMVAGAMGCDVADTDLAHREAERGVASSESETPTAADLEFDRTDPQMTVRRDRLPDRGWDFDADGRADFVMGFPGHDEGKPGSVIVVPGSPTGLSASSLSLRDPAAGGVNGHFGQSLTSSDFDRDGYDDLVVASVGGVDGRPDGHLMVFRGSSAGLQRRPAATIKERSLSVLGDLWGVSVLAAQLTDDDWPDLAVTSRTKPVVLVFRGGPDGFSSHRAYAVRLPRQPGPRMSRVLAAGDVDDDSHLDLVVSSSFLTGSPSGPHRPRALVGDATVPTSAQVLDITGDRLADVVLGLPYRVDRREAWFQWHPESTGRIAVFPGSSTGPRPPIFVDPSTAGVPGESEAGDLFGASVVAADADRDGRTDLLVGAPGAVVSGAADAGAITMLRWTRRGLADRGHLIWTQDSEGIPGDVGREHRFAAALAALDVTGDGRKEILAVATGEVWGHPAWRKKGVVSVIPGMSSEGASGRITVQAEFYTVPLTYGPLLSRITSTS